MLGSTDPKYIENEVEMRAFGAILSSDLKAGDVVLLEGELGAGKTTLVRGILAGLGWPGEVRSPTFNLLQIYPTEPPVLHADLYRVKSWEGIGIEDYLESHLCLIEWPDRAASLIAGLPVIRIQIEFECDGRRVRIAC
jgi:tRNA threonylcarbamoyladenosine biosynthesis protein TsaE